MSKKTTSYLILFGSVALVAVSGFIFSVYYIKHLNTKIESLKTALVSSQVQFIKLESIRLAATSGAGELDKLEKYIISAGKEIDVVQQIERLAEATSLSHNTELIEEKDEPSLANQNKNLLHIVLTTDGTWNNSRKFLSLVEHLPYNVKIEKVDMFMIGKGTASSSLPVWRSKFDFSIVKEKPAQ